MRYPCTGGRVCFCDTCGETCDDSPATPVRPWPARVRAAARPGPSPESAEFEGFMVEMKAQRARDRAICQKATEVFGNVGTGAPLVVPPRKRKSKHPPGYSRQGRRVANPATYSRPRLDRVAIRAAAAAVGGIDLALPPPRPGERANLNIRTQLTQDLLALGIIEMRGGGSDEARPVMWRVADFVDLDGRIGVKPRPALQHTNPDATSMACTDGVWSITQRLAREAYERIGGAS